MRPYVIVELPLPKNARILCPDQVVIKIGNWTFDVGAFCYATRSNKRRSSGKPCEVVVDSLLTQRPGQIMQLIAVLSSLIIDRGMSLLTVRTRLETFKLFLDWADSNSRYDCLASGDATRRAFLAWAEAIRERYLRQELSETRHNHLLEHVRELLEATTNLEGLGRGTRKVKYQSNLNTGTEPLSAHDFANAVALNQALFDGLCDLVLDNKKFPYKLILPETLGWEENHLWIFPTNVWCFRPDKSGTPREELSFPNWPYDYANGRLADLEEIVHRYKGNPSRQRDRARQCIAQAHSQIEDANRNARNRTRIMLGKIANDAFLFLFFSYTGGNESVVREIETDGHIDTSTLNQQFRSIKYRAGGKAVTLAVPATFMPVLRRFMALRDYLLEGREFPYLFFTLGRGTTRPPGKIPSRSLFTHYMCQLRRIDPTLPPLGARKLRASVADWYQRNRDAAVTAKVLQNSEKTVLAKYDAGSLTQHQEELTLFLNGVSEAASRQRVIDIAPPDARALEEGGCCSGFGSPDPLAEAVPATPNCRDTHGCLFCTQRILIANEADARKVASAAFVMEQVVLGPIHEEAIRPLIAKCDQDLEKIAMYPGCRAMVDKVRNDVYEKGNLTPYFADKYQLFLELGMLA